MTQMWAPWGNRMTLAQRQVLAVATPAKPSRRLYDVLWRQRMEVMLLTNVPAAAAMIEAAGLDEKTLDLWTIAQGTPPSQWIWAVRGAESTQHLMRQISWASAGAWLDVPTLTPAALLVELQSLRQAA